MDPSQPWLQDTDSEEEDIGLEDELDDDEYFRRLEEEKFREDEEEARRKKEVSFAGSGASACAHPITSIFVHVNAYAIVC